MSLSAEQLEAAREQWEENNPKADWVQANITT